MADQDILRAARKLLPYFARLQIWRDAHRCWPQQSTRSNRCTACPAADDRRWARAAVCCGHQVRHVVRLTDWTSKPVPAH